MLKKIISLILCIAMVGSNLITPVAYANESGWDVPVVQIHNDVIKVTSDKQTGRFIVETISGIPNKASDNNKDLLYADRFQGPETSYTSVRIDGEDFIFGNSYGFMGLEGHYTTAPYIDLETNTIISQWAVKDVVITQRIAIMNNPKLPSVGNVYVDYEILNKSNKAKSVGLRMLLDTKLGSVDSPALTIPGEGFIYKEEEFTGDEIPNMWYAYNQYITPQIIARGTISGEGLTKPDKLQFAAWGDVSQTKWDYTVNSEKPIIQVTVDGLPYTGDNGIYPENSIVNYAVKDSCAVMYYNPEIVESGDKKSIKTSYGVGDASEKAGSPSFNLSLQGTDKLNMKQDKSGYTIDYVSAEFDIDNNFDNSTNLNNVQIDLELPDELELVEGDKKSTIKSVIKGDYHRSIWKIRPKVQDEYIISAYSVVFRAEGMSTQRITKILIMEGKENIVPEMTFLDYAPKTPFYVYDKSRSVSVNGSGFGLFGSAVSQIMEAKLIKGSQTFTIDMNSISYISDSVIQVTIPDNIPLGTYDLFLSAVNSTGNKNHQKTFKNAVIISDDIKYSHNLVNEIEFPVVMKDDGINSPEETIKIEGIFIDNGDNTYTSLAASISNPVIINQTLKFANGTLKINKNPMVASIWADDGTLWCDIKDSNKSSYTQAIIAKYGFKFEPYSIAEDEDTKVRMVYNLEKPGANYTNDVSYKNIPIKLNKIFLTSTGIQIDGSMSILNPLTYMANYNTPNDDVQKLLGEVGLGYCQAELGTVTLDDEGLNIDGKFSFQMPFVMSLFSGTDAILELNTREEHVAVEVGVSVGNLLPVSAGVKTRIGFRRGRFDEYYVSGEFPKAIEIAPPIPIGISGLSGGIKNTCFEGAFPITFVLGLSISDTIEALSFQSYNFFSMEGEAEVSPFHYESESAAYLYMIEMASVKQKYVWWTLDPTIETRGLRVEGTIVYRVFTGNIMLSYFEGEGFIGRGTVTVEIPEAVPVFGGLVLAGVGAEITEYSIAAWAEALNMDIGIRYYFHTNKLEFLELQEELEKANHGINYVYSDGVITEYGFNFVPIQFTQSADENSQYITELNLTSNSDAILVLRMTEGQFASLNNESIKIINPAGEIQKIKYINNSELIDSKGNIKDIDYGDSDMVAVKQKAKLTEDPVEYEYMVSIPMVSPSDGQWTIITQGSMEILPYSSMKKPEITSFSAEAIDGKIKVDWKLDGEPDNYRIYIVDAAAVEDDVLANPAKLWGTGNILYGQYMKYKDKIDPVTGKTIKIEDEVVCIAPTKDGELGTFTTEKLNLPSGKYYVYAKAEKENTFSAYKAVEVTVENTATPNAPTGLMVEDIGNNQIKISWDADYTMNKYFIYRKSSIDEKYETGSPYFIYEIDRKSKLDRFEIVVLGDEIDQSNPKPKTYYFDVRAVGNKQQKLLTLSASPGPNETLGSPVTGYVSVSVPEEITAYTEIRSADDKMFQQSYTEKNNDGIEQLFYKYVTKSPNIIINSSSNVGLKYQIEQNGAKLSVDNTGFVKNFSKNVTLKEGINYFNVTYENEGKDTSTEQYTVEYDNKAPSLIITEPVNGDVAASGRIKVSGTTEPESVVSINNVNYTSDMYGNFSYEIALGTTFISEITIEARDTAGNVTKTNISVLNDITNLKDITVVPEYKIYATGMKQKLSTYVSENDELKEKLNNNLVKYSIIQGSDISSINDEGILTAKYAGTVIVKADLYVTDNISLSDTLTIEITGDNKKQSSKYYPPVYSKELLTWLAGSAMSTSGGIIKTPDGVILDIPKGALPYYQDNIDIFTFKDVQKLIESLHISNGATAVSSPYQIGLVSDFVKPVKLTLPLTGTGNAYIYYYDEEAGALIYRGGTMSADKKTVTADITKPGIYVALNNPLQSVFADITPDFWGYNYIYALNYLNIINGYNNTFRPNANITRAEFIKLLVMTLNINLSEADNLELKFADNDQIPAWAIPYIKAAYMKGLINGKNIGNKNYIAANEYITREEITAIIGRSIQSDESSNKKFNDNNKISSWAQKEINKLISKGIISGYEDNTFRPMNNATRAEASVMIYKYLVQFK